MAAVAAAALGGIGRSQSDTPAGYWFEGRCPVTLRRRDGDASFVDTPKPLSKRAKRRLRGRAKAAS